ncbi:HD domain protein [uncultured archaeon]|nr:HD domain protein [uncultured archaeon]
MVEINDAFIDVVVGYSKKVCSEIEITHSVEHVERVVKLAAFLSKNEGADGNIVKISAWLHDIGYVGMSKQEMINKDHAAISAKLAQEFLEKNGLDSEKIEKICDGIRTHRNSRVCANSSVEAKCLHDADKLDCIGIRGLFRMFVWDTTIEPKEYHTLSEYLAHLKKSVIEKENVLLTNTARCLARKWNEHAFETLENYRNEELLKEITSNEEYVKSRKATE